MIPKILGVFVAPSRCPLSAGGRGSEILHIPSRLGNVPGMLLRSHEAPQPRIGGEKGGLDFPKREEGKLLNPGLA